MEIKYIKENYYFETLSEKHDLDNLDCGDNDLNDFLKNDALIQLFFKGWSPQVKFLNQRRNSRIMISFKITIFTDYLLAAAFCRVEKFQNPPVAYYGVLWLEC